MIYILFILVKLLLNNIRIQHFDRSQLPCNHKESESAKVKVLSCALSSAAVSMQAHGFMMVMEEVLAILTRMNGTTTTNSNRRATAFRRVGLVTGDSTSCVIDRVACCSQAF